MIETDGFPEDFFLKKLILKKKAFRAFKKILKNFPACIELKDNFSWLW